MSVNFRQLSNEISVRYLEIKGCGANRPGGGGFSAGNTCARSGSSSAKEDVLFHGTTIQNAEAIKTEGLKVQDVGGAVYASHKEDALVYACGRTYQYAKENNLEAKDLPIAVVALNSTKGFTPSRLGEHYSLKDVPASQISSISVYKFSDVFDRLEKGKVVLKTTNPKASYELKRKASKLYVPIPVELLLKDS